MDNSNVWALVLTHGQYEDRFSTVVSVFADKFKAEYEVRQMNTNLGILQGLIKAEGILQEEWHKANPRDDSWGMSDEPAPAYLAWIKARDAEYSRLDCLFGIEQESKKLGVYSHDVDHARASLSEVPFTPFKS
jgi:hypothetical protein